jgi:hypothetical protein
MDLKSLQRTMVWVDTDKPHLGTEVGTPACARKASSTRYLRLNRNPVPFSHRRYALPNLENETRCFVAKNAITLDLQLSDRTFLPEVHIRTDTVISGNDFNPNQLTYPQIPVALIWMSTSPGPGLSTGASTNSIVWLAVTCKLGLEYLVELETFFSAVNWHASGRVSTASIKSGAILYNAVCVEEDGWREGYPRN